MSNETMHLIVYTSKIADIDKTEKIVSEIVETAKTYNSKHNITGVLLFENGYFLQAIEGSKDELEKLYTSIENDNRHKELTRLIFKEIDHSSFDKWSMEAFKIENSHLFDPKLIGTIQKIYDHEFDLDSKVLIDFIKKVIDEIDTFKIAHDEV